MPTPDAPTHPGARLNLPASGVGSVASMGSRVLAFVVDLAVSFGVALLFTGPALPQNWSLVAWAAMTILTVGIFGFTPGQAALGIRVAPLGGRSFVGGWALPRTVLTFLIVPPLIVDADGRGLHDRICRTVVIRYRASARSAGS
ncbi:MAG: RDD family protein [Actinomycetota bacterium]|nr:RDD family protein [Actinomycetota bacterium]